MSSHTGTGGFIDIFLYSGVGEERERKKKGLRYTHRGDYIQRNDDMYF
jgi:hypothetical protein